jgi:hypothetical protein
VTASVAAGASTPRATINAGKSVYSAARISSVIPSACSVRMNNSVRLPPACGSS